MANAIVLAPMALPAVTASSTAAGYSPAYVGNDYMGVVWKSAASGGSQSLTVDFGSDVAIDTALLLGCTGATSGWTLTIEAATAALGPGFPGGSWSSGSMPFLAGAVMTKSNRGRSLWVGGDGGPPASRYWRFTIGGLAGAAATVARLVLGERIALARNFQFGATFGLRDTGSMDFSSRGVMLRYRGAKLRAVGVTFGSVYRDEVEEMVQPLIDVCGNSEPIALISDPDPHAQRQNRIWFGPMVGDLGTVWPKASGFEWKCNLVDLPS
jgi:hypothetical protein